MKAIALRTLICGGALAFLLSVDASNAEEGQELAQAAGSSLIGTAAPKLVLKSIDGEEIDLGSLYGRKAVYLKFWATWCTICRQQMPHFKRAFLNAGQDLAVIAVDVDFNDSLDAIKAYRRKLDLTMPIVIDDGRLAAALHLRVTPEHIVIGRDGRILFVGHLIDDQLEAALVQARQTSRAQVTAQLTANEPKRYGVGAEVPNISSVTLDGQSILLKDPDGTRPTVLVFLSPWCEEYLAKSRPQRAASCRAMREQVDVLAKRSHARWLGISSGLWAKSDELAAYRDERKVKIPLTLDESGSLFRTFGVTGVPTVLLVSAKGKIVGRIDRAGPKLKNDLVALR